MWLGLLCSIIVTFQELGSYPPTDTQIGTISFLDYISQVLEKHISGLWNLYNTNISYLKKIYWERKSQGPTIRKKLFQISVKLRGVLRQSNQHPPVAPLLMMEAWKGETKRKKSEGGKERERTSRYIPVCPTKECIEDQGIRAPMVPKHGWVKYGGCTLCWLCVSCSSAYSFILMFASTVALHPDSFLSSHVSINFSDSGFLPDSGSLLHPHTLHTGS